MPVAEGAFAGAATGVYPAEQEPSKDGEGGETDEGTKEDGEDGGDLALRW